MPRRGLDEVYGVAARDVPLGSWIDSSGNVTTNPPTKIRSKDDHYVCTRNEQRNADPTPFWIKALSWKRNQQRRSKVGPSKPAARSRDCSIEAIKKDSPNEIEITEDCRRLCACPWCCMQLKKKGLRSPPSPGKDYSVLENVCGKDLPEVLESIHKLAEQAQKHLLE